MLQMTASEKDQLKKIITSRIHEIQSEIFELEELTKPIPLDAAIGRVSRMDAINNKTINESSLREKKKILQRLARVLENSELKNSEFAKNVKWKFLLDDLNTYLILQGVYIVWVDDYNFSKVVKIHFIRLSLTNFGKVMMELLPNHYYHIYNRGNNKESLFYTPANYEFFLKKYLFHCFHIFETYSFCLMGNHFHLLVSIRSKEEQEKLYEKRNLKTKKLRSPSKHLSNFFSSYTQAINKQEDRTGSLFQKNFKRKEVDSQEYFQRLVVYIHQNPIHHGFSEEIKHYPYSSYRYFLNSKEPSFINRNKVLKLFGEMENFEAAHEEISFDFGYQ